MDAKTDRVQDALQYARRNLARDLSVEKLAKVACLSPRQFSRVFRLETGLSPRAALAIRVFAITILLYELDNHFTKVPSF
jgi:transcriptional regulator GlxA family with amidase domain